MGPREDRKKPVAGYSLIEVLIVLGVISIIAAIAMAALLAALDRARQKATMADMRTIAKAIEVYRLDHGYLPAEPSAFDDLRPVLEPYQISVLPVKDHWGFSFRYCTDEEDDTYHVVSYGRDGVDGLDLTPDTQFEFERDIVLANGMFTSESHRGWDIGQGLGLGRGKNCGGD